MIPTDGIRGGDLPPSPSVAVVEAGAGVRGRIGILNMNCGGA